MGLLFCYQCKNKNNCMGCSYNPSGESLNSDLEKVKRALNLPRNTFPQTHKSNKNGPL